MPEAPEMQVAAEFLNKRLPGRRIKAARALKPAVRSLSDDFELDAAGRAVESVSRRGKFIIVQLSGERRVVINPKLTGVLQYVPTQDAGSEERLRPPSVRRRRRSAIRGREDDGAVLLCPR